MKSRILGAISCAATAVAAFPASLQAQQHDLAKLNQGYQQCDVEGWLGHASYQICVQAVYQDLLNQPPSDPGGPEYWGNTYGCSAGSRICG